MFHVIFSFVITMRFIDIRLADQRLNKYEHKKIYKSTKSTYTKKIKPRQATNIAQSEKNMPIFDS